MSEKIQKPTVRIPRGIYDARVKSVQVSRNSAIEIVLATPDGEEITTCVRKPRHLDKRRGSKWAK